MGHLIVLRDTDRFRTAGSGVVTASKDLRHLSKIGVSSDNCQTVLHRGRHDPEIVRSDRGARLAKGFQDDRAALRRLAVDRSYVDPRGFAESFELLFVPLSLASPQKPRAKLSQNDRAQVDRTRPRKSSPTPK